MAIFGKDGKPGEPRQSNEAILSIIAAGMHFVGDLDGPGLLKIDGQIEGSVSGPRQIIVGRDGRVAGNVHAAEVVLAGTVEGSVVATDRVELQSTAVLTGDLHAQVVIVHEGARVNGTVRMSVGAAESAERPAVQVMR